MLSAQLLTCAVITLISGLLASIYFTDLLSAPLAVEISSGENQSWLTNTDFYKAWFAKRSEATPLSCVPRLYNEPPIETGLPYLGEVFASRDRASVYFVGINNYQCHKGLRSHERGFHSKGRVGHRFICLFSPGEVMVMSDFVHPSGDHEQAYVIRCMIPREVRWLIGGKDGEVWTHLRVSLISILNTSNTDVHDFMDVPIEPSFQILQAPRISDIPVCSHLHPMPNRETAPTPQKRFTTLMTMLQIHYHDEITKLQVNVPQSEVYAWIEYHRMMGVEHFVFYDNDEMEHGPLEEYLAPYVQKGLVTYAWMPMRACLMENSANPRDRSHRIYVNQFVATNSALRRYEDYTGWFFHADIDEYFAFLGVRQPLGSLALFLHKLDPKIDAVAFKPYTMDMCNGTIIHNHMLRAEKFQCWRSGAHYADTKLMMRASRVLYFYVHYVCSTVDHSRANVLRLNDTTEGLLLHFRSRSPNSKDSFYHANNFSGIVLNPLKHLTPMLLLKPVMYELKRRVYAIQAEYAKPRGPQSNS